MKKNILLSILLFSIIACAPVNQNNNISPTPTPTSTESPINISTKTLEIYVNQSEGKYNQIPVSMPIGTDFSLKLNGTVMPYERSIKTNDEAKLKFVSTEKKDPPPVAIGAIGEEIWKFKALEKGEFELSFRVRRPFDEAGKYEDAETLKITIR